MSPSSSLFHPLRLLLCASAALVATMPVHAEEAISTDRPDFVESSDVVGRGRLQIESGLSFERDRSAGQKSRTRTTPTLIRIGAADTLELRIETDGFASARTQDTSTGITERTHGFSDGSFGIKWHTQDADADSGRPGMAWLVHVDVDSGSAPFRGQSLRPSLRAVAEWDLPHDASIGVMPGIVFDKNAAGSRFTSGIFAVTLGKSLSPALRGFVEVAGQQLASNNNGGHVVTFDTGLTYLVTDSLQLDFSIARGLTSHTPDFQWGVGAAVRF